MSTNTLEQPRTPEEWKNLALSQRIGELTTKYENEIADLRVALTIVTQERDELRDSLNGSVGEDSEG